jgi:hypothetical protein
MSNEKGAVKRSRATVETDDGFTERVLMSLVMDITQLEETVERVKVQVITLAKEKGVSVPES